MWERLPPFRADPKRNARCYDDIEGVCPNEKFPGAEEEGDRQRWRPLERPALSRVRSDRVSVPHDDRELWRRQWHPDARGHSEDLHDGSRTVAAFRRYAGE